MTRDEQRQLYLARIRELLAMDRMQVLGSDALIALAPETARHFEAVMRENEAKDAKIARLNALLANRGTATSGALTMRHSYLRQRHGNLPWNMGPAALTKKDAAHG